MQLLYFGAQMSRHSGALLQSLRQLLQYSSAEDGLERIGLQCSEGDTGEFSIGAKNKGRN